MSRIILFLAAAFVCVAPCSVIAAEAPAAPKPLAPVASVFTDAQRAEVENIIKDYLVNKNPEVMAEGLHNYEKRMQEAAEAKMKEKIVSERSKIYDDPATPVGGNPKAKVTVVEFYDYLCGYCKMAEGAIEKLLKEDNDVKFVYKNFPVLGPASLDAAKAGLASAKQGKFQAFHTALMNKKERLTSEMIYQIAKDVGLNVDKLKKDMADPSIDEALKANMKLGEEIGARGTPFFIINDAAYPGAMQYEQLKEAVGEARKKVK